MRARPSPLGSAHPGDPSPSLPRLAEILDSLLYTRGPWSPDSTAQPQTLRRAPPGSQSPQPNPRIPGVLPPCASSRAQEPGFLSSAPGASSGPTFSSSAQSRELQTPAVAVSDLPARASCPPSRLHSPLFVHRVCPSPALRLEQPARSTPQSRPARRPPWTQARSGAVHGQLTRQPHLPHLLLLLPPGRGRLRRGDPPSRAFDPEIPGPSLTRAPGPQGSSGQPLGRVLSTPGFWDPSCFSRSQGF